MSALKVAAALHTHHLWQLWRNGQSVPRAEIPLISWRLRFGFDCNTKRRQLLRSVDTGRICRKQKLFWTWPSLGWKKSLWRKDAWDEPSALCRYIQAQFGVEKVWKQSHMQTTGGTRTGSNFQEWIQPSKVRGKKSVNAEIPAALSMSEAQDWTEQSTLLWKLLGILFCSFPYSYKWIYKTPLTDLIYSGGLVSVTLSSIELLFPANISLFFWFFFDLSALRGII